MEYYRSKWKYFGFLIFTIAITIVGIILLPTEKPWWWGTIAVVIGILGSFIFVKELLNNQPRLMMDDEGITDLTLKIGKIHWTDIRSSNLMSVQRNKWITLEMSDACNEKYLSKLGKFQRKMTAGNVAIGLTPLNINVIGLKVSAEDIFEKFGEYLVSAHNN